MSSSLDRYKLVRDNVPSLVIQSGQEVTIRRPHDDDEFERALKSKVIEEVTEVFVPAGATPETVRRGRIEELADVYEILKAICEYWGLDMSEIIQEMNDKEKRAGGYQQRILLQL